MEPWPRLFHNLRASRETELAADHPIHVVTAWLGNTPAFAMKHYLQVTDSDFDKAAGGAAQPVQATITHDRQNPTQAPSGQAFKPNEAKGGQVWQPPKVEDRGLEPLTF